MIGTPSRHSVSMSLGLTPADAHVPSATWERPKRRKAVSFSEVVQEMEIAKSGLYVGRLVVNTGQLAAWAQSHNIVLDPFPHVTVVYSTTPIPSWELRLDSVSAAVTGWKILGPDKAVVLLLDSDELRQRWQEAMDRGGTSTYGGFIPHVTLFYLGADGDPMEEYNPFKHPDGSEDLPTFPILLGPEVSGDPEDGNVYKAAGPTQAVQARGATNHSLPSSLLPLTQYVVKAASDRIALL